MPATVGATPRGPPRGRRRGRPARDAPGFFPRRRQSRKQPRAVQVLSHAKGPDVDRRLDANLACDHAGVVNTQGWVDGGVQAALHALDALKITDVFVIGQERPPRPASQRHAREGRRRGESVSRRECPGRCRCGSCSSPGASSSARGVPAESAATEKSASTFTAPAIPFPRREHPAVA